MKSATLRAQAHGTAMTIDCPVCATRTTVRATRSDATSLRGNCRGCGAPLDIPLGMSFVAYRDSSAPEKHDALTKMVRAIDEGRESYLRDPVKAMMEDRRFTIRIE